MGNTGTQLCKCKYQHAIEVQGKRDNFQPGKWEEPSKHICGGGSFIAVPAEWVEFQCQKQKEGFLGGMQAVWPGLTAKAIQFSPVAQSCQASLQQCTSIQNLLDVSFPIFNLKPFPDLVVPIFHSTDLCLGSAWQSPFQLDTSSRIKKTKIMAPSPSTSWQIEVEKWKQWQILISWAPKSLRTVTAAMKLRHLLFGKKAMTNLDSVLKSRGIPCQQRLPTKLWFFQQSCKSVRVGP